ncbi:hypothetical protein PV08_10413 [Exophiala spinifera]|uniref:NADPH-dependent FMN reductase-like domain-containing protein n=1 Tax=Exophiala spinifera TaxID=91928 RepID=A0A0D2AWP0_9EURO|nr:uncharacterized protein PV08_10413 [Exophiala spinifera]KIW11113.1 hypothetical protein PV08_10413 [Exophiala spinifera]
MSANVNPPAIENELTRAMDAALRPQTTHKIGVIVCSQRKPRAGLQIGTFVLETLQHFQKTHPSPRPYELSLIDLNDHPLPLFNEPDVPSRIKSASDYKYSHTRAWSELVSSYNAFVFVTPQYNWGYPASIKNAIDYLFNEWRGKPAMVVSYGGHGGGKAALQLLQVLEGVNMKVTKDFVALQFPDRAFLYKAAHGENLNLNVVPEEADGQGVIETEDPQAILDGVDATDEAARKAKEPLWAKESRELCSQFWELVSVLNG